MPYRVRKSKGRKPWLIQKKEGARWKTVGRSESRNKARASVRARKAAE